MFIKYVGICVKDISRTVKIIYSQTEFHNCDTIIILKIQTKVYIALLGCVESTIKIVLKALIWLIVYLLSRHNKKTSVPR